MSEGQAAVLEVASEAETHPPAKKQNKPKTKPAVAATAETETVKTTRVPVVLEMGTVNLIVPVKLIKTFDLYREESGNIRADKAVKEAQRRAEEILVRAQSEAQQAYIKALEEAFESDEEFQYALLEKDQKRGGTK